MHLEDSLLELSKKPELTGSRDHAANSAYTVL